VHDLGALWRAGAYLTSDAAPAEPLTAAGQAPGA